MTAATLCCVTIDRGAPEPLYQQLAQLIRGQIADGTLPPRSKLGTLEELAGEHHLAISTVQKAVGLLKAEGLVVTWTGRGMYVA